MKMERIADLLRISTEHFTAVSLHFCSIGRGMPRRPCRIVIFSLSNGVCQDHSNQNAELTNLTSGNGTGAPFAFPPCKANPSDGFCDRTNTANRLTPWHEATLYLQNGKRTSKVNEWGKNTAFSAFDGGQDFPVLSQAFKPLCEVPLDVLGLHLVSVNFWRFVLHAGPKRCLPPLPGLLLSLLIGRAFSLFTALLGWSLWCALRWII